LANLLHEIHDLAGAVGLRLLAGDRSGRIKVVEADERGTLRIAHLDQGSQRHHLPRRRSDLEVKEVVGPRPEAGLGLHIDLKHLAELVELRHIARPEVVLQRAEHLPDGNAKLLGLVAIDVEIDLRRRGAE
jgi:hypothetical protein